jgi:hypothetical protein
MRSVASRARAFSWELEQATGARASASTTADVMIREGMRVK